MQRRGASALLFGVSVRARCMLVRLLAMRVSRVRVLSRRFVVASLVMVRRLMMVMRSGMMVLARGMFW